MNFASSEAFALKRHFFTTSKFKLAEFKGGAVAEWSMVLLLREKINKNQKIPGLPLDLGKVKK